MADAVKLEPGELIARAVEMNLVARSLVAASKVRLEGGITQENFNIIEAACVRIYDAQMAEQSVYEGIIKAASEEVMSLLPAPTLSDEQKAKMN